MPAKKTSPKRGTTAASTADFTTANAYASVPGTRLDTERGGPRSIAYRVLELNVNAITVKLRGSIDGVDWVDLITLDEAGTARGGVDVAVAKNAGAYLLVTDALVNGARMALRLYDLQAKSTIAAAHGSIRVSGFAK